MTHDEEMIQRGQDVIDGSDLSDEDELHYINTERLRCSCGAPMCFDCGWCSAQCKCSHAEDTAESRME